MDDNLMCINYWWISCGWWICIICVNQSVFCTLLMKNIRIKYPLLVFYFIIINKQSINDKHPGGLWKFSRNYFYQYNDDLIVITNMGSSVDTIFFKLELLKFINNEDYFIGEEPLLKDLEFIKNSPYWCKISYNNKDRLYVEYIEDMLPNTRIGAELEKLMGEPIIWGDIKNLMEKYK
jgi:hypothetical protein